MSKRHTLAIVDMDEQRERVRKAIVAFIEKRWLSDEKIIQKDIISHFEKPPFNMSSGSIRNILNELVEENKIQAWHEKGNRCYGLPKMPVSLKTGLITATLIIIVSLSVEMLSGNEFMVYLYNPLNREYGFSMLPFVVYGLFLTIMFTVLWYHSEQKMLGKTKRS